MKEITIEDVLKKHYEEWQSKEEFPVKWEACDQKGLETIYKAMTEYASINRQGWTRVETELPKQGQRVLIATNTGSMEVGYYYKGYWERNWAGTTFGEAGYQITHWMPLPNKPEPI